MIELKKLITVGAHFGHQTSRWCPKMERYIWGQKNNVHLIDVSKTAQEMEKASQFLKDVAAQGKNILWIGTKKAAQDIIRSIATDLNMPYVTHRWVGGTLSNYTQVKKSVTKLLHYEDIINKADKFPHYTKKELNVFGKVVDRLKKNVGGIKNLSWPLGAIVVVDVTKERSAIKEAATMGIPVVAIVDTNGDPSNVDYVIPANDDAPRVIKLVMEYLANSAAQGKELAKQKSVEIEQQQEVTKKSEKAAKEGDAQARAKKPEGVQAKRKPGKPAQKKEPVAEKPAVVASENE